MGTVCFGSCCGPCPHCNPEGEIRGCYSSVPLGVDTPSINGMLTGELDPSQVFEPEFLEEEN